MPRHLVKGEVLSPEKIRATTGGIAKPPHLSPYQPFQNPTIPLAFRRASVCVCLYGFVSALSLAQHHVLASPRKRGGAITRKNSCDYRRDCSPSAPSMRFSALSLAPHHILASLVKGELLLPEKNLGDYRRDCSLSAPTLSKPHCPTKTAITLASLKAYRLN